MLNKQSSFGANAAFQLWQRLTEPLDNVQGVSERTRVRFLSSIFLLTSFLTGALVTLRYLLNPGMPNARLLSAIAILGGISLLIPYWLARQGRIIFASQLIMIQASLLIFVLAALSAPDAAIQTLSYLLLLVLFASHFISIRWTLVIAAFHILGIFLFFTQRFSVGELFKGPVIFHAATTLVIAVFAYYRAAIERQQQNELVESEQRYRTVLERMPIYSYCFHREPDGTLVKEWVTDSFEVITGYTWQEVFAMGINTLYHPDDVRRQETDAEWAIHTPTAGEYRIITKDGQVRWIHLLRYVIHESDHPQRLRRYGIGQDITERKESEAKAMKSALQRERLALMDDFVQAISHDFRTSLATIETNRYLIQRTVDGIEREKVEPRLDVIQKRVYHMKAQIENLHAVTALANLKLVTCDLNNVLNAQIIECAAQARQRGQALVFRPNTYLPSIQADVQELGRAINHLLVNALNYTPQDGTITVSTTLGNHCVLVEIRDTGVGIAEEHLPHIFELFYRADSSRQLASGGVGLGLSLVRMIIEAHGGDIQVESTAGSGSTFTLSLPLEPILL